MTNYRTGLHNWAGGLR